MIKLLGEGKVNQFSVETKWEKYDTFKGKIKKIGSLLLNHGWLCSYIRIISLRSIFSNYNMIFYGLSFIIWRAEKKLLILGTS